MEEKKLLKLIKDDIAHLDGITGDFSLESPPSSDEVELLHKVAAQHESVSVDVKFLNRLTTDAPSQYQSDPEPFELFSRESIQDDQQSILLHDRQDHRLDENKPDDKLKSEDGFNSEESDESTTKMKEDEKHFSALVEPTESADLAPQGPVIVEEKEIEEESHVSDSQEPVSGEGNLTEDSNEKEVFNAPMTEVDQADENAIEKIKEHIEYKEEAIVHSKVQDVEPEHAVETVTALDNIDHTEDQVAGEYKELKKTLNETLGESHQMVNDILSPEKEEIGFQIIQLNSIWDGIGINDRFLFIRELFANSSAKFENTINALDKLSTIQEAVNYLKMNFKWNKTEASHKFLILVKRRFIK